MLRRLIKLAVSLVVYATDWLRHKLRRLTGRPDPTTVVVLYYHAVKDGQAGDFALQMDRLLQMSIPWRAEQSIPNRPGHYVAVTFDDGFHSVVRNALPVLKDRSIPFTVFCPTGSWGSRPKWIKQPEHSSWEERVLSGEELRELAADPLVTVGSHSVTHPNFLRLTEAQAVEELRGSKDELEDVLGQPVTLFSFPHGACSERLVARAQAIGYRRIFTITPSRHSYREPGDLLGRVAVEPSDWEVEFYLKAAGAYRWLASRSRSSGASVL